MADDFNYNYLLNQAYYKIKTLRDSRSIRQEYIDRSKHAIDSARVVSFGGYGYEIYENTVKEANRISVECLDVIIYYLFKHYGIEMERIEDIKPDPDVRFAYFDKKSSCLLVFKDPEKDFAWVLRRHVPEHISALMKKCGASIFKYVYLLYDGAEKQIFGGRVADGFCSIKWFFETYFTSDEYEIFHRCFTNYIKVANDYLGFTILKTLTASTQVNFRRVVMNRIVRYDYSNLIETKMHDKELPAEYYTSIFKQFIDENAYLALLGDKNFAESFVTAEWLYDSMKEAKAIDLTVIAMGYFKAIEQLLYAYLLLHKNDNLKRKTKYNTSELINVEQLENDNNGTAIGPMAHIFKDNTHIIRKDVSYKVVKYVIEAIFIYKDNRNGYLHKDNINDWEIINQIRDDTYKLAFLFLGAATLSDSDKDSLGYPQGDFTSDMYRLCEYVNYHAGDLFFLCFEDGLELFSDAQRDPKTRPFGKVLYQYSGAYFSMGNQPPVNIVENLPSEIYLGNRGIQDTEMVEFRPYKVLKIFDHGKYVGPSIYDETGYQF